jgi:hypothetical protein
MPVGYFHYFLLRQRVNTPDTFFCKKVIHCLVGGHKTGIGTSGSQQAKHFGLFHYTGKVAVQLRPVFHIISNGFAGKGVQVLIVQFLQTTAQN